MPDIVHLVRIRATPERVYQALTDAQDIRQWWTREAELDARVGGRGEFRFYDGKVVTQVRIEALEPSRHVAWRTTNSGAPGEWKDTTISFELRAEGDETVLRFAHRGFAQESEGFALVSTGWAYYLVSLKRHLEAGDGAPQQDKDFVKVLG